MKRAQLLKIKAQVSSIWAKGFILISARVPARVCVCKLTNSCINCLFHSMVNAAIQ